MWPIIYTILQHVKSKYKLLSIVDYTKMIESDKSCSVNIIFRFYHFCVGELTSLANYIF
jgi:hypothetical protein